MNASCDNFTLLVQGRGGHAAHPHRSCDPIVAAAGVVMALQTAVSRRLNPLDSGVVTVGIIRGGTAPNIIPDAAELHGTIRTLDPMVRKQLTSHVKGLACATARAFGASAEFSLHSGESVLWNNQKLAELVRRVASRILPPDKVKDLTRPVMGGDDFASLTKTGGFCSRYTTLSLTLMK
jgi:hippurate hydrolase